MNCVRFISEHTLRAWKVWRDAHPGWVQPVHTVSIACAKVAVVGGIVAGGVVAIQSIPPATPSRPYELQSMGFYRSVGDLTIPESSFRQDTPGQDVPEPSSFFLVLIPAAAVAARHFFVPRGKFR